MPELHIDLPEHLAAFIYERVMNGECDSLQEYVVQLVESECLKAAQPELEAELLKGLESGPAVEMTAKDWEQIRTEVERRIRCRGVASPTFEASPEMEALLLERLKSDDHVVMDADDWASIRREGLRRIEESRDSGSPP
jgi:Arc/MetJ-type ribon-helix-helix transcriptional regulator